MIKKIKIRNTKFTFVFRHRWEKSDDALVDYTVQEMRRNFQLGLFLRIYEALGKFKGKGSNPSSEKNCVRGYIIGVNLIVCKFWVNIINAGVMELKINK